MNKSFISVYISLYWKMLDETLAWQLVYRRFCKHFVDLIEFSLGFIFHPFFVHSLRPSRRCRHTIDSELYNGTFPHISVSRSLFFKF